jgi:thiol-disulfide isomerase/thioredoxin
MKRKDIITIALLVLISSCTPKNGLMVTKDKDGSKMLVGISNKNTLMTDKAFGWFKSGYDSYKPDASQVKTISQAVGLHIEVFGGTWCDDTHELLPEFYKVMDAANVKDSQITLHLVNRDKKTKDGSAEKYNVTNVPTFVIFLSGKQMGKIVESTKKSIEADIAELLIDKE